ncbi:MAG: zinc metallopeptidase, partial [Clostridia bacterium]|nr:zinc metallopeptidase [Clostridia bacterium]
MCYYLPISPYGFTYYMEYWLFMLPALVLVLIAQGLVSSRYKKFGKINTISRVTGREIAQKILADNGVFDVSVNAIAGNMTDHYHPGKKTIFLSQGVYDSTSIAAVSIAAHEAGHALQHAKGYAFLRFRSSMVPLCNVATMLSVPLLIIGSLFNYFGLIVAGIAMFAMSTLFHLITLPVEFNASRRAIAY